MARSRYRFLPNDLAPYFVTATTVNWLPHFCNPEIAQILLGSLRFLIDQQRLCLHAYVILENHLHLVASAQDLSKEIAKFKSFTARRSIDYYIQRQQSLILDQLVLGKAEHKYDRPYQFWQEGVHPKRIHDQDMLQQKIDYLHQNPVKHGYVDFPEQWRYSSARDYIGVPGLLPVELVG
jgi:REP element-mobilizing transposase RayT